MHNRRPPRGARRHLSQATGPAGPPHNYASSMARGARRAHCHGPRILRPPFRVLGAAGRAGPAASRAWTSLYMSSATRSRSGKTRKGSDPTWTATRRAGSNMPKSLLVSASASSRQPGEFQTLTNSTAGPRGGPGETPTPIAGSSRSRRVHGPKPLPGPHGPKGKPTHWTHPGPAEGAVDRLKCQLCQQLT